MSPEQILFVQTQGAAILLKTSFTIILVFIELFLFVVLNQIRAMNRIVTQPDMFPYLQSFVLFLGICGIVLIVVTLVIL